MSAVIVKWKPCDSGTAEKRSGRLKIISELSCQTLKKLLRNASFHWLNLLRSSKVYQAFVLAAVLFTES